MKKITITITLIAALAFSGCSYLFVDGPHSPSKPAGCSTGKGWVAVDGTLAVLHGLLMIVAMSANAEAAEDPYMEGPGTGMVVINGAWTAVHTLSAVSGSGKVNRCREAYAEEDE